MNLGNVLNPKTAMDDNFWPETIIDRISILFAALVLT